MPYRIDYDRKAQEHLRGLTARQRANVVEAVKQQLGHQPAVRARNRKLLRPNPIAAWELRVGDHRVFYNVIEEPEPIVLVQAVGSKVRNRVFVAGVEIRL